MGRIVEEYLPDQKLFVCHKCRTHLTSMERLVSKSFHGKTGQAYLFAEVVNVDLGPAQDKMLMTGLHSVCDVHCKKCHIYLGWKYIMAYEQEQKYKIGKTILEKALVDKADTWV
eukprot:m.92992 g.92992  ORF g.92992 m.92992 type:complete len:114 (-) comp12993_c0_seq1:554-895(-)